MELTLIKDIISNYPTSQYFSSNYREEKVPVINEMFNHWNISVEWKTIDEITNFASVIYPIVNLNNINPFDKDIFPPKLRELLNHGLKICIFHVNEAFDKDDYGDFVKYLKLNNIRESSIILFVNNYKQELYNKIYESNIRYYNPYYQLQIHSNILQKNEFKFSHSTKKFLFMCHNNKMWSHRLSTLVLLKHYNIIDDVDFSCVNFDLINKDEILNLLNIYPAEDMNLILNQFLQNKSQLSFFEKNYKTEEIDSITINLETFKNSYVNIVTETDFIQDVIHITEKSLKPFYYFQYPIFVAPQGHVKKLKELYDFDFFDDVIDHSYDDIEDNSTRLKSVLIEIDKLHKNKNHLIKNYILFKDRFELNQIKVKNIIDIKDDVSYIKNNFYKL